MVFQVNVFMDWLSVTTEKSSMGLTPFNTKYFKENSIYITGMEEGWKVLKYGTLKGGFPIQ